MIRIERKLRSIEKGETKIGISEVEIGGIERENRDQEAVTGLGKRTGIKGLDLERKDLHLEKRIGKVNMANMAKSQGRRVQRLI